MKYLIVNQKNKVSLYNLKEYIDNISNINTDINLIIAPNYIHIPYFLNKDINIAIQDISSTSNIDITGIIDIKQVKEMKIKYAIIGHYERRKYFNEGIEDILNKINLCIKNNIIPIYCINEIGIKEELDFILPRIDKDKVIFAFEPSYSIGSDSKKYIDTIIKSSKYIREFIENSKFIYGGGINSNSIMDLLNYNLFDGFMVSNSGININELNKIMEVYNGYNS